MDCFHGHTPKHLQERGGSFRQYLSAFIVIVWPLQILFYSGVIGKIDLQGVRCYKVVSFPYSFYLAALNLEGNRNFVVIIFV